MDKIIYINLDKRTDRRNQIEQDLAEFGLLQNTERFPAIPHPNGCVGCGYSHLSVLQLAQSNGWKNVLILEDDFHFVVTKKYFDNFIETILQQPFDVVMLGYHDENVVEMEPYNEICNRVLESSNACGYLVNSHYYSALIDLFAIYLPMLEKTGQHWNYANDVLWKRLQKLDLWLLANPKIGKQRSGYSDNSNTYVEY